LRSIDLPSKNSPDVSYLTTEQVLAIHFRLIQATGGSHGLRDLSLLESAVARPSAGFGDTEFYPDVFAKPAALMESLILNHPYVDGNKRTGIAAARTFLRLNGWRLTVSQSELVSFTVSIATGSIALDDITNWLCSNCVPIQK
jgi:death on curing protein